MELKLRDMDLDVAMDLGSNRTFMELKFELNNRIIIVGMF